MELLGNCSNKNNYEYTDRDVENIMTALEEELSLLKTKFKIKKREKFTLK